ncbi:hypothetical protein VZT92_008535 [Zoarces viviparus]|uniref:Transposase n=1 Tax=Zoarces viviparus TaxID=48416 RepID=A0AAW1FFW1_ZOAVI
MDETGVGPHNGIDNSRYRRNYVILNDLRNPGFIFPPTGTGDRNYVGIKGFAEFVAKGGIPNHPPTCVVYNRHRLVAEDVIAINDLIHNDEDNDNMNNIVNIDNNDGINNDNVDDNAYNCNLDAKVPEDDPLPGPSRKRKREPDRAEEERSCKKSRRWDESAESDTDFNMETETSPIEHAKVPEVDPLPGPGNGRESLTE